MSCWRRRFLGCGGGGYLLMNVGKSQKKFVNKNFTWCVRIFSHASALAHAPRTTVLGAWLSRPGVWWPLDYSAQRRVGADTRGLGNFDNYWWKDRKGVFEGCVVFSVAFRLNTSQRTLPSDITIISYRPHKSNTRNAIVDLWSFVERFSKN